MVQICLVGQNYITDVKPAPVALANGEVTDARWIQFKIHQPSTIGNISDFRSIRFMRIKP
jgi:cell surface protein SprA